MFSKLVNSTIHSNYHAIDHCDNTRGIDNLLTIYKANRDVITNAMINDPQYLLDNIWTYDSPLSLDDSCKCKMGYGNRHSASICAECTNLRRIIDFRTDVANRPFTIECGAQVGKQLIITSTAVDRPFLIWDIKACNWVRSYVLQQQRAQSNLTNIIDHKYVIGDAFTMEVLQTFMINRILKSLNLPHSVEMHTAFICNNTGHILTDSVTIGSFNNLKKLYGLCTADDILSIILQLLVTLTELSKVNFSHGNPTINALVFDKQPVSYKHNNMYVQGRFTVKLVNLSQSSGTYNNIVYHPYNALHNMILERSIFVPEITTSADCWYKITTSTTNIYQAICRTGLPLFVSSFDFYCLFVSLMMDKDVYQTVLSTKSLIKLWTMLWKPNDLLIVQQRLTTIHNEQIENNIDSINVIRLLWLRCDVLSTIWSSLA